MDTLICKECRGFHKYSKNPTISPTPCRYSPTLIHINKMLLVKSFKHKQKIKKSWACIYLLYYGNQVFLTSETMRLRSYKELIYIWYYFIDLLTYALSLPNACCGWIDATEVFLSLHIVLREKIKFTFKFF